MVALAVGLPACAPSAAAPEGWRDIDLRLEPMAVPPRHDGRVFPSPPGVTHRALVRLTSPDPDFGGLSDLAMTADGRLLAITDRGDWLQVEFELDAETGAPVAVRSARMADMRDERGAPLVQKRDADAEDLAILPDGRVAVSFEQSQTIRLYDLSEDAPPGLPGPELDGVARLSPNRGLEAMAIRADGALIVTSEMGVRLRAPPVWIAAVDAGAPVAPTLTRDAMPSWGVTALDALPDGGLIAMERQFVPPRTLRARLTYWTAASLTPGARVVREDVAHLGHPLSSTGNYEGVSALVLPDGAIRLYLLVDDNFADGSHTDLVVLDWRPEPSQTAG